MPLLTGRSSPSRGGRLLGSHPGGETAGDLFAQPLKLGDFRTAIALFLIFVVTLVVQLRSNRYSPFFY
ncbi:hypothetical protein [Streptomyces sp. NPDC002088]|uniref:hypothetical protein n=1 Tax=Streptomyces sp. NPDC002088 TaxID=3154665 RepID=UPI00332531BE